MQASMSRRVDAVLGGCGRERRVIVVVPGHLAQKGSIGGQLVQAIAVLLAVCRFLNQDPDRCPEEFPQQ